MEAKREITGLKWETSLQNLLEPCLVCLFANMFIYVDGFSMCIFKIYVFSSETILENNV